MATDPLINIIDRIKTIETAGKREFNKVESAVNFAVARDDLKNSPAAYVIPLRDSAGGNQLEGGAVSQPVKEQFGVLLAVSNFRDATGVAALIEFRRLRKLVIGSLLGFDPGEGCDPVEYAGGNLLAIEASVLWWQLVFTTGYQERNY